MAKGDIMPYRGNASNGMNPTMDTLSAPLTAAATFVQGEPVTIVAAGTLSELAEDGLASDFAGIAAHSGDTVGATDPIGMFRNPLGLFTPGASPNLPVAADMVMFWKATPGQKLITRRLSSDGTGATLITPLATHRGDPVSLEFQTGNWGFDITQSDTLSFGIITDILDANGEDISRSGLTGVFVVAEITKSRWNTVVAPS